jgi:hypothetical protein
MTVEKLRDKFVNNASKPKIKKPLRYFNYYATRKKPTKKRTPIKLFGM